MPRITQKDFENLINENSINCPQTLDILNNSNLEYNILSGKDKENAILKILKKIDSNELALTGDKKKWEIGWGENLEEYRKTKNISNIRPKFQAVCGTNRFNGEYIASDTDQLEVNMYTALHYWTFYTYFKDIDRVFDFGCGTGEKLKLFSDIYPNTTLHGLDWVQQSADEINLIRQYTNLNMHGHVFDMFNPDYNLQMPEGCGVYTSASLEQLGDNYGNFIQFLLKKRPSIVVNIEPIFEFYNENILFDYLSIKYHTHRKYLKNYYTVLKKLEAQKKIQILKSQHITFGNFYHDGYSIIVWKLI